jgi:type I restriction enzyme S subunit
VPKLRFKELGGEWEEKKLKDCLDYLQPTKYLVSSTTYDDKTLKSNAFHGFQPHI